MNAMPDAIPMFPLSFRGLSEYEAMRKPDFTPSYHTGNPPWAGKGKGRDNGNRKAGNPGKSKK